ncbi:dihydrofolate reductase [Legionella jamestowniensis]|uniref:Dihydrofolate reductase n=1 Tax=Legionella jamestowniensis TaxID=455 RepID=A0ABX2XWR8_9GAMM|nr:dihydrofolate reductase [Legionella jamestowniensis]OCH99097.1 dihydrofolate reductase [Legionella jamestowniensis]
MTIISLIAAVDENYGLGKDNHLLCHLPADLKHFKKLTMGKPIIMGKKTFDSIGKPLPGRLNIVLSKQSKPIEGVEVMDSFDKALALVSDASEVMIIGGAMIYQQALSKASRMYLTMIHHQFHADVFFPEFDKRNWQVKEAVFFPKDENNSYDMTFYQYERLAR